MVDATSFAAEIHRVAAVELREMIEQRQQQGLFGQRYREVPRGKPVASVVKRLALVAANVKYHGASPWHR